MGRVKEYYLGIIDNEKEENVEFLVDPSIYEIEIDLDSMSIPTYTGKSTGEEEGFNRLLDLLKEMETEPKSRMIERAHEMALHYVFVDEVAWKLAEYIVLNDDEKTPYVRALEVFMSMDKKILRAIERAQYVAYE